MQPFLQILLQLPLKTHQILPGKSLAHPDLFNNLESDCQVSALFIFYKLRLRLLFNANIQRDVNMKAQTCMLHGRDSFGLIKLQAIKY